MNYKEELDKIDSEIKDRTLEKTRLETKLENLKLDRDKIIVELKEAGIEETEIDKLNDIIAELEIHIEEEINKIKKSLEV